MEPNAILDTIIIYSPKIKELAAFYQQGLQLKEPKFQGDDHLGFQIATIYLGFDKVDVNQPQSPGSISLWFRVDNIYATFNRFKQLGAKVRYSPTKKAMGEMLASVFDPEGNIIGLAQRKIGHL
jgi:predicted enzyme related to lactoylglutathione lyase